MDPNQSAKEEIKRAADLVELIGQFVQLKRAGQNYVGLCPFHLEKDPSFTVSPSKQFFHCYGCRKGGDVFAFWMEYHKVSFPEAIRDLAERYRIALPKIQLNPAEREKAVIRTSLLKINKAACDYFHHILTESEKGEQARVYLAKRSISTEIVSQFKLGYAPDEWDGLIKSLRREDLERAFEAGLVIRGKKGGYYDRFRGRVMFPIFDLRGRVLGFGGRVLNDSLPKYLNTPESPLFHKGERLYGLHASYGPIRENGRAVIVEGYMDLLALKRHGFHEAVATLGTALTREHIRMLKGYAKEAIVVFDADAAGKTAAVKSLPYFMDEGLPSKVALLPENDDPDTFVNKHGLDSFQDLLNRSVPMFDFYIDLNLSQVGDRIEGQVSVFKEMIPLLTQLKDAALRSFYVRRLSEKLGVSESSVLAEMQKWIAHHSWDRPEDTLRERVSSSKAKDRKDLYLLNLLVHHPAALDRLMDQDFRALVSDPVFIGIFDTLIETYRREGKITPSGMLERLDGEEAREIFREVLLSQPICRDHDEVEQAIKDFEDRIHRMRIAESKKNALERGDIEGLNQILKMKKEKWG